jgi:hypothetical protein
VKLAYRSCVKNKKRKEKKRKQKQKEKEKNIYKKAGIKSH